MAAPTTSLPEHSAVNATGITATAGCVMPPSHWKALQWRSWLLRAIAGDPQDIQIMYGVSGERELPERVLANLPGYEGSARFGSAMALSTNIKATL